MNYLSSINILLVAKRLLHFPGSGQASSNNRLNLNGDVITDLRYDGDCRWFISHRSNRH